MRRREREREDWRLSSGGCRRYQASSGGGACEPGRSAELAMTSKEDCESLRDTDSCREASPLTPARKETSAQVGRSEGG